MAVDATALLAQLDRNPSGRNTDGVLRAIVAGLAAPLTDFWPDPADQPLVEPGLSYCQPITFL